MICLHGQNQTLLRHVQKFFFKLAHQHVGPLDQRCNFIKQRVVINRMAISNLCSCSIQLADNFSTSICKTGDYRTVFGQRFGIAVSMLQNHRVNQRLKPVAVRGVASFQPQRLDRHHIAAMQSHQTMRRPHKLHIAPAIS